MISNKPGEKSIGILGTGFGLYGYMPALAIDNTIVLVDKYKYKFDARPELQQFNNKIRWVNENAFFEQIDGLIICLSPAGQYLSLTRALAYPNIRFFILEKPIAIDPERSDKLLEAIIKAGKNFRIGYNFRYTSWGAGLLEAFKSAIPLKIKIDWHFLAHHYSRNLENWKRYNDSGGGAIRFYGIHLIALLGGAQSCRVLSSLSSCFNNEEIYKWTARFEINSVHLVDVEVNIMSEICRFAITIKDEHDKALATTELNDPFDEYLSTANGQDRRVGVIKPVLESLNEKDRQAYWNEIYKRTNKLWANVENLTTVTADN